ncbi:YozE family protein [Marinilactibacillus piezotolerans]|uniref:YozE family protein n=1 Tax=Marinilactibacillus piezotolerans TaxID=258723 RepID=UPI0009B03C6D|nr:YozE family protein [Marinilactibacillus piezotolerans]
MRRSFYHYLMTQRDPNKKDDITLFANAVEKDGSFPKHSEQYDEISAYLELNGHYLPSMDVFDEAWNYYKENNA